MTSDISEFTPPCGSSPPGSAPLLSGTITPTPSTRYTTKPQPPRTHPSTSFTTASEPLTPSEKSESVYATAEWGPSLSRPSTIAISPSTEYAEVYPTTPSSVVWVAFNQPKQCFYLAPQLGTLARSDYTRCAFRQGIIHCRVKCASSSELSATPTLSRTMSIASRSRTGTILSGPARPSPTRSVASRSSALYVPASTPSVSSIPNQVHRDLFQA